MLTPEHTGGGDHPLLVTQLEFGFKAHSIMVIAIFLVIFYSYGSFFFKAFYNFVVTKRE